jgi:hypothetical protein
LARGYHKKNHQRENMEREREREREISQSLQTLTRIMFRILTEFQFKSLALGGRGILITVLWEGKYNWVSTVKLMMALKTKEVGKADALKL